MYCVTFYSFKGGVGRTMSLVNVACSLVRAGRRVLIVDFDLEAPGLSTFDLLRPDKPTKGILEYVNTYVDTGRSPDVNDYVYKCPVIPSSDSEQIPGDLWVMPAGLGDDYKTRFATIDWQDLYENRDGFLMFEDLRDQWREAIKPDYVLIDSRTGHTDISGICTRQLPDAVAILFFPNEQNLDGLEKVVGDIRGHASALRRSAIQLHFVAANVPDLDDDEGILQQQLDAFRKKLGYSELSVCIHHYDNLMLLRQSVFSVTKPRSKLALEYAALTKAIVRGNLDDKVGVLDRLNSALAPPWLFERGQTGLSAELLTDIEGRHGRDPDVLFRVGRVYRENGRYDEAVRLLTQASALDPTSISILKERAQAYLLNSSPGDAAADWRQILNVASTFEDVMQAALTLQTLEPTSVNGVLSLPSVAGLTFDERCELAGAVLWEHTLPVARQLGERLVSEARQLPQKQVSMPVNASTNFVLLMIYCGQFELAMAHIRTRYFDKNARDVADSFNLAMADWAARGEPNVDLFREVAVNKAGVSRRARSANFHQCLAIVSWVLGEHEQCFNRLEEARRTSFFAPQMFSSFTYYYVRAEIFREHIDMMKRSFTKGLAPAFEFMPRSYLLV